MTTHVVYYYEEPDQRELVEIDYQCSYVCMRDTLGETDINADDFPTAADEANLPDGGSLSWGACPGGAETDYDVHCSSCGTLLWEGLETDNDAISTEANA